MTSPGRAHEILSKLVGWGEYSAVIPLVYA